MLIFSFYCRRISYFYLLVKDFIYYKNKFSEGNYNYTYNITIGDSKYIFDGSIVNNVNSGYKESNMGIIKYYLDY